MKWQKCTYSNICLWDVVPIPVVFAHFTGDFLLSYNISSLSPRSHVRYHRGYNGISGKGILDEKTFISS